MPDAPAQTILSTYLDLARENEAVTNDFQTLESRLARVLVLGSR